MLQGQKKAEPFRSLKREYSINWLEPELMKGKAFEDSELRANAAGMCGLAALTCAETSRAHASIIHATCKTFLPLPNASQEESNALKAWRDDVSQEVTDWVNHIKVASDVGAKLSAALFNKEMETIRQQLAKSTELAPARTILLNSGPSQMCLLSDDKRIAKAMEATDKQRPYAPKPTFNRSCGFKPRGAGMVTSAYSPAGRMTPYQKPKAAKSPVPKKSGNPKGRLLHRKRGHAGRD
jgi:hypothetical protein